MAVKAPKPPRPKKQAAAPIAAKLIRIGNSRGVRLPKALIEQAGIVEDIEISLEGANIILKPAAKRHPRAGWDESFRKALAALPPDFLERELEEFADFRDMPNDFDEKEWTWPND